MADLILVVDDEPVQRRLLESTLGKLGYDALTVDGGQAAIDALENDKERKIKAVILDLVMPEVDGLAVLEAMKAQHMLHPVIVQTAQGGVETAVSAMRAGAVDFVIKPAAPQRLQVSIKNALKMGALSGEIKRTVKKTTGKLTVNEIISCSPNMEAVKRIASRAAQSNIPVLIDGESGVGKEMVAGAIQGMSNRQGKKFVTVNCGALPENLVESILFGHEKGAFTGASDKHIGKFQEADGGTLFLDEVGELPLDVQVKLLRAIQEGEVDPVGSSKPVKVDIRLISATNRNLYQEVVDGKFREDLYYRLNVLQLTVPPLRDRREDIPALLDHFVTRIAAEEGRSNIHGIKADAIELLGNYHWPGNIRQLENAIFRAVVLCEGDELTIDEFPNIVLETQAAMLRGDTAPAGVVRGEEISIPSMTTPVSPVVPKMDTPLPARLAPHEGLPLLNDTGDVISLEQAELKVIEFALEKYDGNLSIIARKLGIGRSTLYRKIKQYGVEAGLDEI